MWYYKNSFQKSTNPNLAYLGQIGDDNVVRLLFHLSGRPHYAFLRGVPRPLQGRGLGQRGGGSGYQRAADQAARASYLLAVPPFLPRPCYTLAGLNFFRSKTAKKVRSDQKCRQLYFPHKWPDRTIYAVLLIFYSFLAVKAKILSSKPTKQKYSFNFLVESNLDNQTLF